MTDVVSGMADVLPEQQFYRVALAQISTSNDVLANLDKCLQFIEDAKSKNAQLVVFPEQSLCGHYGCSAVVESVSSFSSSVHSALKTIQQASKGIAIMVGFPELSDDGLLYNSSILYSEQKQLLCYRKINIPTYGNLDEGKYFASGNKLERIQISTDARSLTSILICADSWNPALVYLTALHGVHLLIQPISAATNAFDGDANNASGWEINTRHSAMTYGMYVVMVNRVGNEGDLQFFGKSKVVDPFGKVLIEADHQEQLLIADIDWVQAQKAKLCLPTVRDAAPQHVANMLNEYLQYSYGRCI